MSRVQKWGAVTAVAVVASAGAWYYAQARNRPQFLTATVQRGAIESTISATGTCNAEVTVQVGSQVSGNIKALYADFNTKVKKGQLVALIDPELFQAKANQAQANVQSAQAAVANALAGVARADAQLASAKANIQNQKALVARAQAAVQDAKTKFDRRAEMFRQGLIAKEERDTAQTANDSAAADLEAAKAQLDASNDAVAASEAERKVAQTQVASAKASVQQAQAGLKQAQVDLEHTEIRAPVDGTVVARRMDVGQTVAASFQAPTIFEIAQDLAKMQVDTSVDEADIGRVKVGQPATFTVDAYPGTNFQAQVGQIRQAPINTQNVITYDVVVTVDNSALKLLPGMTANVRVLVAREDNVLKVPNAALRFRPPDASAPNGTVHAAPGVPGPGVPAQKRAVSQTVWVLDAQGQPRAVPVQPGLGDGTFTAIDKGDLREGDRVITGLVSQGGATTPAPAPKGGRGRGPGF